MVRLNDHLDRTIAVDWEVKSFNSTSKQTIRARSNTVKTLYNVIRYNRIFNIRHKIAGNGSVSIKIPSL